MIFGYIVVVCSHWIITGLVGIKTQKSSHIRFGGNNEMGLLLDWFVSCCVLMAHDWVNPLILFSCGKIDVTQNLPF